MPGGGGGRKDILVVQDENDGQTVNAKTRRDPLRRLPLQLRRRLKRGGWRVDNWLTQPTFHIMIPPLVWLFLQSRSLYNLHRSNFGESMSVFTSKKSPFEMPLEVL